MSEEYADEFSDSERRQRDDDDQHTQKVNGKMESMQMKVEELTRELSEQKKATRPNIEIAHSSESIS